MTIRVHYGTQSYIVKETDPRALAQQAFDILTSGPEMSGIWNLETMSGEVYLLLTRSTPIAVEDFDEVLEYEQHSMHFSEIRVARSPVVPAAPDGGGRTGRAQTP